MSSCSSPSRKAKDFVDTTISRAETIDAGNGRIETQTTTVIHHVDWLQKRHDRPTLKAIVMVESTREIKGVIEQDTRFHITSRVMLAHLPGPVIRSHWAIETGSHWVMAMVFHDDERGSEPILPPRTSPPSNIWRITCSEGLPDRINSACDAKPPGEMMSSSRASSPHEIFARYVWFRY
jgi:hypothetical protein